MKRVICFVIILASFFSVAAYAEMPLRDEAVNIQAPSALLMEKETGQVIYEKNAHDRLFPASITKIMTMLLIVEDLEQGVLKKDDIVTASARAASFGGSCVYLEAGEQMSVHEMLKCIAVVSANDCAVAMAEHISGSEEAFVKRMNERAQELGLKETSFTSCTGLFDDEDHYTTAYDVAIMARELIKHDMIKEYTTIWMDSIRGGEFELANTNRLVHWYPGCTGLKTGFTSSAMYCLAATAERDGVEYIAVIMHGQTIDSRNTDAQTLLDLAFGGYSLCSLRPNEPLQKLNVELGKSDKVALRYEGEEVKLVEGKSGALEYELELPESVKAPVKAGDKLGSLTVTLGGEELAHIDVCAAEDVERLGFIGFFSRLAGSLFAL